MKNFSELAVLAKSDSWYESLPLALEDDQKFSFKDRYKTLETELQDFGLKQDQVAALSFSITTASFCKLVEKSLLAQFVSGDKWSCEQGLTHRIVIYFAEIEALVSLVSENIYQLFNSNSVSVDGDYCASVAYRLISETAAVGAEVLAKSEKPKVGSEILNWATEMGELGSELALSSENTANISSRLGIS